MKYAPLLMQTVGGAELITSRLKIEFIMDHTDLVREAGGYTLTRKVEGGEGFEWKGNYTVYWRLREGEWVMERVFISKK